MAIQFPPQSINDPKPVDGETYLYLVTQEEFVYDEPINAWSALGKNDSTSFGYKGSLFIQQPEPNADVGNIYSVADGATAANIHPSFTGLYNVVDVQQYDLVIYDGSDWQLMTNPSAGPWVRTINGVISPVVSTDNLDMNNGDYVIESLPDLH